MIKRKITLKSRLKKSSTRGLSLIETAMVLAVISLLMVLFVSLSQTEAERIRSKNTADRLTTISEAAKGYLSANYANLLTTAPLVGAGAQVVLAGRTVSGGAVPAGSLQDEGFLSASFIDTNPFQQNTALLVRRANGSTLEALITTYGGDEIPDHLLGMMVTVLGPEGGFVPDNYVVAADAGDVLGFSGGWRTEAATWGAAATRPDTGTIQMTMAFEDGEIIKDYLYRNDIGVPEANRMNTDIDLDNNSVRNIGSLHGIADAVTGGQTVVIGDVADPTSLRSTLDIWSDRDVISGRDVTAANDITATNDITAGGNLNATGNLDVDGSGDVANNLVVGNQLSSASLTVANDSALNGNVTVGGNTQLGGDLTVAGVIDANMQVESTDPGRLISRGDNFTLADFLPRMVAQYSYLYVENGGAVPFPTCAGGDSNARIMAYKQVDSVVNTTSHNLSGSVSGTSVSISGNVNASYFQGMQAVNNGNRTWRIQWAGAPRAAALRQAIVQTFCFYG